MNGDEADLAFLPLGGTGEIGMNLNLYRCNGKWLAVDCGIGFGGSEYPEVDIMTPDPGFIAERRDRLLGLVITHAHEDHIGAVAWLWPAASLSRLCHAVRGFGASAEAGGGATSGAGAAARRRAGRRDRIAAVLDPTHACCPFDP